MVALPCKSSGIYCISDWQYSQILMTTCLTYMDINFALKCGIEEKEEMSHVL
jgi:hypothetical protein